MESYLEALKILKETPEQIYFLERCVRNEEEKLEGANGAKKFHQAAFLKVSGQEKSLN